MIADIKQTQMCKPPGLQLENVDELTAGVFQALGRMIHLNRLVMGRMVAQRGAHHGEVFALALLTRKEGVSQRELGDILYLSAPRVSTILDSLERSGAVLRRPDDTDRRLTRVFLTSEGRRLEKEQRDILRDYVNRTIGALPEADRSELTRLLGKLADLTTEALQGDAQEKSQGEGGAGR